MRPFPFQIPRGTFDATAEAVPEIGAQYWDSEKPVDWMRILFFQNKQPLMQLRPKSRSSSRKT